ncbi:hypothetical protein [Maridesulfovibrio frigidus]|uniref:hypothetical protein n=1 Tax=Maridesulfovibrio frigidus TaxID=340956 RepID=UPI0004E1E6B9|nr:hypothetical protein [Maridesulfovibrio frigidus]
MKRIRIVLTAIFLCFVLSSGAFASDVTEQTELSRFQIFAKSWVVKLNRSHIKGIQRMEIRPNEDGTYLARYHAIDPTSVQCIVKKTSSKRKGLIGLLKYIETVYESTGSSPKTARKSDFKAVKRTRITEIFSNSGKGWR